MKAIPHPLRLIAALAVAVATIAAVVLIEDDHKGVTPIGEPGPGAWQALAPSPLARSEVGAARVGGSIWVAGGFAAPDLSTVPGVARYEIESGEWEEVAGLPVAVNHPGMTAAGGFVYVHGGYTADGLSDETGTLQRLDPRSGRWITLASSPAPRAAHTLVAAADRLYAIGGISDGGVSAEVAVYDIATNNWTAGPAMRVAREHLAGAGVGQRIFVAGGRRDGRNLRDFEVLDPADGKWTTLPPLPVATSGFGAAEVRGRIAVVGGEELAEGDETIAASALYDPESETWIRLLDLRTPRHGLGVVSRGDTLFAIEGGEEPGGTYSSVVESVEVPVIQP